MIERTLRRSIDLLDAESLIGVLSSSVSLRLMFEARQSKWLPILTNVCHKNSVQYCHEGNLKGEST